MRTTTSIRLPAFPMRSPLLSALLFRVKSFSPFSFAIVRHFVALSGFPSSYARQAKGQLLGD
jgi:hypothetical protein